MKLLEKLIIQVPELLRVGTKIWKFFGEKSQKLNKKSPIHPNIKGLLTLELQRVIRCKDSLFFSI